MNTGPKSRTLSIKGDAHLTTLIDPFSILEDVFKDEDVLAEETLESTEEEITDEGLNR
jgi:hypothetical protein